MNKENRESATVLGMPGVATLVIIFTVLCMSVLAIITLSKAVSDKRLAEKSLNNLAAYYLADAEGQKRIAELRCDNDVGRKSLIIPISETSELKIVVVIGKNNYKMVSCRKYYSGEWESNELLDLWTGD